MRFIGAATVAVLSGCVFGTAPENLVGVVAEPTELFMIVGAAAPISVVALRSDGTRVPVPPRSARFLSSDAGIARVASDSAGLITAVRMGSADVTVTITIGSKSVATIVHVFVGRVVSGQRASRVIAPGPVGTTMPRKLRERPDPALHLGMDIATSRI